MSARLELYDIYSKKLDNIYKTLYNEKLSQKEINTLMRELYLELKKAGIDYYNNEQIDPLYFELIKKANLCELILPQKYICDTTTNYDPVLKSQIKPNFECVEDVLDYIVYRVRSYIHNQANMMLFEEKKDFDDIDLTNKCEEVCKCISQICRRLNIEETSIVINPGFTDNIELFNGNGFHHFNIVNINKKEYIIDCTYKQFFLISQNYIERLGTLCGCGCNPGIFMMYDESHAKTAMELLKKGWIEATEENLKNYLDGFAASNRNGLYCEYNNLPIYETKYTAANYIRMLYGYNSQLDYEDKIWLGYQSRPIVCIEKKLINTPTQSCYNIE